MLKKFYFTIFIILSNIVFAYNNLVPIPNLSSPIMDTANLLNSDNRAILNHELLNYYYNNGSQIVVLTIDDTLDEDSFDYGTRVMDTWKIGRKNIDDGVLILIVKNTKKVHILVGRGLEGAIPDIYAKRIIEQTVLPAFKMGNFDLGIINAVKQIQKLINGENLPSVKHKNVKNKNSFFNNFLLFLIVFPWIFTLIFGRKLGSILMGFLAMTFSFIVGLAWFFCILIGFGYFCFGYFLNRSIIINNIGNDRWFGGGFGGGGNFGGGGGSFGGGGASGQW